MIKSIYTKIETPALLIDNERLIDNINYMQKKADNLGVKLRPHTKTHKMPQLAKMQLEKGACGIAVAKVGEAEVMAENGIKDIFIANEIVGKNKIERIKQLARKINISTGVDCKEHVEEINDVFEGEEKKANILIEIEVGEERSGIILKEEMRELLNFIKTKENVTLKGIFSHEGHTYKSESIEKCLQDFIVSQERTLEFADIAREKGFDIEIISIGATPSLMHASKILDGITEIRTGTYIFMDASQSNAIETFERCAATVLTTIISLPTKERIITDAGAKALTAQGRNIGICKTKGLGYVKNSNDVFLHDVYDEHGIIYNEELRNNLNIGDKIEIIPNHICPACNLFEKAYLVFNGEVLDIIEISCRGKLV